VRVDIADAATEQAVPGDEVQHFRLRGDVDLSEPVGERSDEVRS
jgi:hypothetical protein